MGEWLATLTQIDTTLFRWINSGQHNAFFDRLMPFLTELGHWEVPILVAWTALLLFGGSRGRTAALLVDAVASLAHTATEQFGRLDVVVNNVGGTLPNTFLTTTPDFLEDAFHFNVTTAHALTIAAAPLMLDSGGGSVVNISSVMGRLAGRGFLAYGTAKAALTHYTHLAAVDLAPRIRVNAIDVGSVHTSALDVVARDEKIRTSMEQATPLRRLGHPDEVAAAVLYLASRASGYTTGSVLRVDGGIGAPNLDFNLPDL